MTDMTLRSGANDDTGTIAVAQLLKDFFRATPLGIVIAVIQGQR
jgi:hypothetical protein